MSTIIDFETISHGIRLFVNGDNVCTAIDKKPDRIGMNKNPERIIGSKDDV